MSDRQDSYRRPIIANEHERTLGRIGREGPDRIANLTTLSSIQEPELEESTLNFSGALVPENA
jgi:hypothetical protein